MQDFTRQAVLSTLAIALMLFVALPTGFVLLADPCQIFHKPLPGWFHHGFSDFTPCQNAGLLNNYLNDPVEGFDAVLTGTSLSGNLPIDHFSQHTPWQRTLKLTMPGVSPAVQQLFTEKALSSNRIHHVFWEVFPHKFIVLRDYHEGDDKNDFVDFPDYLYNNSRLDDYRYVFNDTTFGGALDVLRGESYLNLPSISRINYWEQQCKTAATCTPFNDSAAIVKLRDSYTAPHHQLLGAAEARNINYRAVDRYVLDTVLPFCNSNKSVDLFIPPVSLRWRASLEAADFNFQLYLIRHLVEKTVHCRNVRVFAFDTEPWITGDLAHYHDNFHVFGDVQDYMLRSFGGGKHVLTSTNIEAFEKTVVEQANHYVPWASTAADIRNSRH